MDEDEKSIKVMAIPIREIQPTIVKEPEGILKKFKEIYNDEQLIGHVSNRSLRAKLERLRAEMGVDFYNIDREPENFGKFASKYIPDKTTITLPIDGTSISMAETYTGLMLEYDQESGKYKGYNTFKSIVDKVLSGTELNGEELSHVNTHYRGWVSQNPKKDGKWVLSSSFYFGAFGVIYRALYDFVIQVSAGRIQVKKCRAPLPYNKPGECGRLFLPYPGGYEQQFCSNACKMRTYRKAKKQTANAM